MWVKICGVTRLEDAVAAARFGADAVGFVFAESPRAVDPRAAREIIAGMPQGPAAVGVFVDAPLEEVLEVREYCGLDLVQLHGDEDPDYCRALGEAVIKAVTLSKALDVFAARDYDCPALLFETGRRRRGSDHGPAAPPPWEALRLAAGRKAIAAGGLNPDNVAGVVRAAMPYGVDVASGVERSPGVKDPVLMYEFIANARRADYEVRSC